MDKKKPYKLYFYTEDELTQIRETIMNAINCHAAQMPLLSGTSDAQKRSEIKQYFNQTWELYESLFALINADEAYFLRPEPLRHPLIFYYGHTASFYINKLMLGQFIDNRVNSHIESICAVGVDEMSWDDLNTEHYNWPTVTDVRNYRDEVKALINGMIDTMQIDLPIKQDSLAWVVLMGIEHERIHVETSSVIMRMMSLDYLDNDPTWKACTESAQAPENTLVSQPQQSVTLGKPPSDDTYGWDNEFGTKDVMVETFGASKFLVSNQEFMAFVKDDGYNKTEYWTEEGQNWLSFSQAKMPRFWLERDAKYYQRNLLEEVELPLNWPVEVNNLEAKAFCQWKSAQTSSHIRLPTEPEWMCLRNQMTQDLPGWAEAPGNINLEYFASSCPVNKFATGELFDVIGNVWQWTESPFDGFSGFKVHPLYDDFSTPTFDGKHNLIKGGSWISTGNEAQRYSRYAFRRHFFQHAGFRYVQSDNPQVPIEKVNVYEENQAVAAQLELNYADLTGNQGPLNQPNYFVSCVAACLELFDKTDDLKALNLGCSVGRASFELARHFAKVDGLDFTARLIQHSFQLQEEGESRYVIEQEGEIMDFKEIHISNSDLAEVKHKVNFSQGDACNLKPLFNGYDLVLATNVLESVYDPEKFLEVAKSRLNKNGILVLTSNYLWDERKNIDSRWLGGVKLNGENFSSIEGLKELLSADFELITTRDIPSVVRKTARNYAFNNNQLSAWRLKSGS